MKAVVERGFIRPEDALAEDIPQANGATTKTEKGIHSAAWLESLTAHRSAALTATLTQQRDVAVNVARLRPFFRQHIDLSQAVRIFGHDEIRVLAATLTFPRSAFSGRPRSNKLKKGWLSNDAALALREPGAGRTREASRIAFWHVEE